MSDINRLFKSLGTIPIYPATISRTIPKGFHELTHQHLKSLAVWQEEPVMWEKPHRFGMNRHYRSGIFKELRVLADISTSTDKTRLEIKIHLTTVSPLLTVPINLYFGYYLKKRLSKQLRIIDEACKAKKELYELNKANKLSRFSRRRLKKIIPVLVKETKRKRIVNRLADYLEKADDEQLSRIHPYELAEYWGEKKFSVLNVFLHAANNDLLDFGWDICCPNCNSPKHHFRKFSEAYTPLRCDECDLEYSMDFNKNTQLIFRPNPLIRRIINKQYCAGGPGSKPFRISQHYLELGEDKYLKVHLEEGTYIFKSHQNKGHLKIHVRESGADNVTLYLTDEDFKGQEVTISTRPNLVLSNRSSKKVVCFLDKENWKQEAIYASEVSSSVDFRSLFSRELIKESTKIKTTDLTILFTDLMNSTEMYLQEGDEMAIGRVMSHFKIIQQIVAEERGGIVKTIGDSVMAVFREPVSALKAIQRIQQIFTTSTSLGDSFKIKAGIHMGDCTAVNLNGKIDYFGTTVNLASRLVDVAKEKEVMLSEAVFDHPDVQLYLDRNSDTFFVKETQPELKGFEDEEIKIKQIRMERPTMRLVI
ncbi:adenylate/guanylate cyclase domain-containing protein [Balneola sp. MJW-20]